MNTIPFPSYIILTAENKGFTLP